MRTTLNIDDDLIKTAKAMADLRKNSLGAVISELIRTGLEKKTSYTFEEDIPVFEVRENSRIIRLEDVKSGEDDY